MALYFGSDKRKVRIGDILYHFNIVTPAPILQSIMLKSSDDYILKDFNGSYLTVKESE